MATATESGEEAQVPRGAAGSSPSDPETGLSVDSFYDLFARTAERCKDRTAIELRRRDGTESVTYGDLRQQAEAVSAFLCSHQLKSNEACAILGENDVAWCAAYLGILRVGAIAVPLDTHYVAQQIGILLRDSRARILLTTERYAGTAREALQISPETQIILLHGRAPQIPSIEEFRPSALRELPPSAARRDDPAVVLYTSGTTSDPKGVVLTHGNLLSESEAVARVLPVNERDSVLGILPLYHSFAQTANLIVPFRIGACVIFLEDLSTSEVMGALRELEPTAFFCVPKFYYLLHERVFSQAANASWPKRIAFRAALHINGATRRLLGLNLGRLLFRRIHAAFGRKIRYLVTAGARFEPSIGRDFYNLGLELMEAYGLTESSAAATITLPGEGGLGTVGKPLPGVEIKIFPVERGTENGTGEGEIGIRGPTVMRGYLNRPDATAETIREGWLMTGDLGRQDFAGQLTITGRKKEIIVLSSGKKVYPEDVEAHYGRSPYIKEICVLGASPPGTSAVEGLHGIVVPDVETMRAKKVINMREVLRFEIENLSVHLPSYQRLLSYDIWVEGLPRTTTSKLRRYEIERRMLSRRAQTVDAPSATAPVTEEEAAWLADPLVAQAFEVVRESTRFKHALRPESNLELDLGLDSIERVELLTNLELILGSKIPDEMAQRLFTVRQLIEAARPDTASAGAAPESGDPWRKLLADLPEADPFLADLMKPHAVFLLAVFVVLKIWRGAARFLLGFHVTGLENIPSEGPFLLCPNHQTYLDPFLLSSSLSLRTMRRVFFVGASEYFQTPFRRWAARLMHIAPVDPDTNLVRAMQAGAFGLRKRKILVLFPEGERSIDGEVRKFKKGAAILAIQLGVPIIPAAFDGAFEFWPRDRGFRWSALLPWNRTRVRLQFGQVIAPTLLEAGASGAETELQYSALTNRLRNIVAEMQQALRRNPS